MSRCWSCAFRMHAIHRPRRCFFRLGHPFEQLAVGSLGQAEEGLLPVVDREAPVGPRCWTHGTPQLEDSWQDGMYCEIRIGALVGVELGAGCVGHVRQRASALSCRERVRDSTHGVRRIVQAMDLTGLAALTWIRWQPRKARECHLDLEGGRLIPTGTTGYGCSWSVSEDRSVNPPTERAVQRIGATSSSGGDPTGV